MNSDEINAKERAWKQHRSKVLAEFIASLTPEQEAMRREYNQAGIELSRLRTWRRHKPNIQKKIPKVVPWPPGHENEK